MWTALFEYDSMQHTNVKNCTEMGITSKIVEGINHCLKEIGYTGMQMLMLH